eukprot:TRINITY_DN2199_c4_g2_i1.p1 TRINITY_DN2199_c4_g2~~TRINITY_DN2199_c4_g2_i1.p1  ORF type:complete len:511 (+),score=120.80 TRINITY_DN2199_c4_g2_i1:53-1534(+)
MQNTPAALEQPALDSVDQENTEVQEEPDDLEHPSSEEKAPQTKEANSRQICRNLPASGDPEPEEMLVAGCKRQASRPDAHVPCAEKETCQMQKLDCDHAKKVKCGCGHDSQQHQATHQHQHHINKSSHSHNHNRQNCNGKGWKPWPDFWDDEPRYDGWTRVQWQDWTKTQCGSRWIGNKRVEAERVAEFMVQAWGLETLQSGSGVIDVGGEPGLLASALLQRGVRVTVVDPSWGLTGKNETSQDLDQDPRFQAFHAKFDENFVAEHKHLLDECSAIVSLYGDEATAPCLEYAAVTGKPCAVMPCNECVRFWPPHNRNYDGYAQSLLFYANQKGGKMQRATLQGAPFSWVLIVQLPCTAEGLQMQEELQKQQQQMQQMQQIRMQNWQNMQMQQNQQQHQQLQQHQHGLQPTQPSQCQHVFQSHQHGLQETQQVQCQQQSQQHEHGQQQAQQLQEQRTQMMHPQPSQTASIQSPLCDDEQSSEKSKKKTKHRQKK